MNKISSLFLVVFILFLSLSLSAQAQEINIDQSFSYDTVFRPFQGQIPVSSMKIDGEITLLSDSSLVRVVLIDDKGNHFLVYEAYPLLDTLNNFTIRGACDETCYLENITPDSIRIDVVDATIFIDKLIFTDQNIPEAIVLQAQSRILSDALKIRMMNTQLRKLHMYWRAGKNLIITKTFQEKEEMFGKKFNIFGFDYYAGGIFQFAHKRDLPPISTTYTASFDWRNRHSANTPDMPYYNPDGIGWITPLQDQTGHGCSNSCWDFAATHSIADYINIYCNNMLNYNLSEEEVVWCSSCGNCYVGNADCVLDWVASNGIHREDCCEPFHTTTPGINCSNIVKSNCQNLEKVYIGGMNNSSFGVEFQM
ncbi:MAG: hypothetical protein M0P47_13275 [Bacteroidales bacterium]|nr:hypothetical protein [Bacteroidales bacterium]